MFITYKLSFNFKQAKNTITKHMNKIEKKQKTKKTEERKSSKEVTWCCKKKMRKTRN